MGNYLNNCFIIEVMSHAKMANWLQLLKRERVMLLFVDMTVKLHIFGLFIGQNKTFKYITWALGNYNIYIITSFFLCFLTFNIQNH